MTGKKLVMIFLLISLAFTQSAISGVTGKIAGRIVEKRTDQPLAGANIIVENLSIGTASGVDGNFTILNVPPGVYSVRAMVIGYAPVTISNVRVRIDQTTRIDFELEVEAIAGEAVVVRAERKIIKEDVATSVTSVSGDEIVALPYTNLTDIIGLQAGVEDNLAIRGGTADEVLFQIDGITLRDPRTNQPITGIAMSAIKEVSVERGGFNAEYGQVRSGIVNVVTKEGSKTGYSGTITLKYSPPARKHFGISPYDPNSYWLHPYLDDELCWEGTEANWNEYARRQYPSFEGWNSVSQRLLTDSNPNNDLSPIAAQQVFRWQHRKEEITDQPDYNIDAGFGGPIPLIGKQLGNLRFYTSYRRERKMLLIPLARDDDLNYDWSLQLTSDISPSMKLKISGLMGRSFYIAENWPRSFDTQSSNVVNDYNFTDYIISPEDIVAASNQGNFPHVQSIIFSDSYYSLADVIHFSWAANLTHTLSSRTFYKTSLEQVVRNYNTDHIRERDTTSYEIVEGYFVDEAPMGWSPNDDQGLGDGQIFGAHTAFARDNSNIASTTIKFDLTSQVNFRNLVKTGIEFVYYNLDLDYGRESSAGFNEFVKMQEHPIRGAFYLQDKLEAKGFIANIGLRLDYFNPNTKKYISDPFDPDFQGGGYDPDREYQTEDAKAQLALSPRLGISHPITENSKLFFNYGHFKQLPRNEHIFNIRRDFVVSPTGRRVGRLLSIGNPDLLMSNTISYELGYDHSLFDMFLIQLAGFYHDIKNQRFVTNYIDDRYGIDYLATNNNSYEDIRGLELTIRKTRGSWLIGFANYTYQVRKSGFFGMDLINANPTQQLLNERDTESRYQTKPIPEPYARLNLTFRTPPDFGTETSGINLLSRWSINIIADWRAGWWTTWNPGDKPEILYNVQTKDRYNMDLRFNKRFSFNKVHITFFADVFNVLNIKRLNLNSFSDSQDYQFYFQSLHLPESPDYGNIPGDDRVGEYRKSGSPYQPVEWKQNTEGSIGKEGVIYYEKSTGRYKEYTNGVWSEVESNRMKKILDDRAYIDMPNHTSFNFLNPRSIFFGIRTSFDLD